MAWEARSGLKLKAALQGLQDEFRLNGLGSPFGFETKKEFLQVIENSWG